MTKIDFESLLSRKYQPDPVAKLNPQEDYKPPTDEKDEKKREEASKRVNGNNNLRETESKQNKNNEKKIPSKSSDSFLLKLVSKTPAYTRHVKQDKEALDRELRRMVKSMPQAPQDEWESLPPYLHEVELGNWEDGIQWEGFKNGNNKKNDTSNIQAPAAAASLAQQLLAERRNPYLDALDLDNAIDWEGTGSSKSNQTVPLILELGTAGQSIARHLLPVSRPTPFSQTDNYRNRSLKEESSIVSSTAVLSKGNLHKDKEKMEKLVENNQKRIVQMAEDKKNRITQALGTLQLGGGGKINSSTMGPGGALRTGRPVRGNTGSLSHDAEYIEQLDFVFNHAFVKPELNLIELRQFQRPKLPLGFARRDRTWQFQISLPSTKKETTNNLGSFQSVMSHNPTSTTPAKFWNEADLNPTEGNLVLLEYCEEKPPIRLAKGMASKIVNYYRGDKSQCPVSVGGGDRPLRSHKRPDENATPKSFGSRTGRVERPTRLVNETNKKTTLEDWIGKMPKKKHQDMTENERVNVLPEGVTEILHPNVHGPFIGKVEDGVTQTGLISNCFAAPMFRHEPKSTDFLMILGKRAICSSSRRSSGIVDKMSVVLRPIPSSIFCVGQVEPRERGLVHGPRTTGERSFLSNFVSFMIARKLTYYERHEGRGLLFDEMTNMFPSLGISNDTWFRNRIKAVANFDRNSRHWESKSVDDYPGLGDLGRQVLPEAVAAHEMSCSAAQRLRDLGIQILHEQPGVIPVIREAMVYLAGPMNAAKKNSQTMRQALDWVKTLRSSLSPAQITMYKRSFAKLERQWKVARRKYEVARFIYEELQLTPWHLSSEFTNIHKHAHGTGRMELTGLADPSGGEGGYSFLRESKKIKTAESTTAQIKKITGTDKDLRKLNMTEMASLLRSYGIPQEEINKLERWDRVHVIRELSAKATSDGTAGDDLEGFVRGEKLTLFDQRKIYQERIQEIWRRQRSALSGTGGDGEIDNSKNDGAQHKKGNLLSDNYSDSDDDSDDELAEMLESNFVDDRQAKQILATHRQENDKTNGSLGMSWDSSEIGDAREFVALLRQHEQDKTTQLSLLGGRKIQGQKPTTDLKVVRKRVTKTFPDGRQVTTFKFILSEKDVHRVEAEKRNQGDKREHVVTHKPNYHTIGHSFFEEDDTLKPAARALLQSGRSRKLGSMTKGTSGKRGRERGTTRKNAAALSERRMKKRKHEEEETELYVAHAKCNKQSRSRRGRTAARQRLPHVVLTDKSIPFAEP